MSDLKLDSTHDLHFTNGKLSLISKQDQIKQSVYIACKTLLGTWMYDLSAGVSYIGLIMVRNPSYPTIEAELRRVISGVDGVKVIDSIDFTYTQANRNVVADITLTTIYDTELHVII